MNYLRCVICCSKLYLEIFSQNTEIEEGMLECKKCGSQFPIIKKIPVLWNNFSDYLSSRRRFGGFLYNSVSEKMKPIIKKSLVTKSNSVEDRENLEERWAKIYLKNHKSRFYSIIKKELEHIPSSKLSLDYGCSIGIVTDSLSQLSNFVFGVDQSFSAIQIAKNNTKENVDYLIADFFSPVFGNQKFDLIVALNILEFIEPIEFLKRVSTQIEKGCLILSDPYDFDRGKNSVKNPIDETILRQTLKSLGFKLTRNTSNPSLIPWNLKLNPRTTLQYKVDLIVCKK